MVITIPTLIPIHVSCLSLVESVADNSPGVSLRSTPSSSVRRGLRYLRPRHYSRLGQDIPQARGHAQDSR